MPYSSANGLRIYYESYGEGPPIVMVHANPFDHRLFLYQIARWSNFHRVISVDMRGYGRSDKPEAPFTLADMAQDVLGVCADEKIDRAIFVGVSTGSGISLMIGLDHPELAQAIVLVGGSSGGNPGMQKRIDGFTSGDLKGYQWRHLSDCTAPGFPATKLGGWLLNMFNEKADTLSANSIAQIFRARMSCDMRPRLKTMRVPTLVVNGEHDGSLEGGRYTAANTPGARHAVIKGAGHCCNIEDPAAFDEAVVGFLSEHHLWKGPPATG
ncbi:MAG TPA: alpha/beta hydrolase [Beijerinckiaceae bacterium]|jgi:3-oxoadipate enol-lactonase|nr:alpha/beta hydrolase [Beijerinckiaceae bacterium]